MRLALRGVDEAYDFVVIDTSPERTLINVNVLNYVSEVYCPVDPGISRWRAWSSCKAPSPRLSSSWIITPSESPAWC